MVLAKPCDCDASCGMFSPRSTLSSSTASWPVGGPRFEGRWLSGRSARAVFLPTPEEIEAADLFFAKAASNLAAARMLAGDDDQDDDVVELPVEIRDADWLNRWAVTLRYDHPGATLDRRLAVGVADMSLPWARARINGARGDKNVG
jgi:hypothetical protein